MRSNALKLVEEQEKFRGFTSRQIMSYDCDFNGSYFSSTCQVLEVYSNIPLKAETTTIKRSLGTQIKK